MYLNLKKNSFITILGILLLLTPIFYYIFSLVVIIDCSKTKIIKYLAYPIEKIYNPNKKPFCNLININEHKIIFLSDSTNFGIVNPGTKRISEYLEKELNNKILNIDLGGGNANIYNDFIDQSPFIDLSNVKYAILTLNLRIFSEHTHTFLEFYQDEHRYFTKVFYKPFEISNLIKLNKLILNPTITENKISNWRKKETKIDNVIFKRDKTEDKDIEKIDEYFKTYMGKIKNSHPILSSIIQLKENLDNFGIKLIVYSTPINITEAKNIFDKKNKYLINANNFEERVISNLKIIKKNLEIHEIPFLNLTFKIKNPEIFYDDNPSEHINYIGKQIIAKELKKFIKS